MLCLIGGVIIRDGAGNFFVVRRLQEPKRPAFPSFHLFDKSKPMAIELARHEIGDIFRRKVKSELGITPINLRLLGNAVREHRCSLTPRMARTSIHEWVIYEILSFRGELANLQPAKYEFCGYSPRGTILQLIKDEKFDPAWASIFEHVPL